eukprot:4560164-Amphidinium_carterae.1
MPIAWRGGHGCSTRCNECHRQSGNCLPTCSLPANSTALLAQQSHNATPQAGPRLMWHTHKSLECLSSTVSDENQRIFCDTILPSGAIDSC